MSNSSKMGFLVKNTLYFFVTTVLTKLIGYILLPIFTAYLTTEEYGIADILMSTNNMVYPIIMLGLSGAVLRFCMDEKEDKNLVITSASLILIISTIASFVIITPIIRAMDTYSPYAIFVPLMCMMLNAVNLQTAICKATDKLKFTIYSNVVYGLTLLLTAIITVVVLDMGVTGYLLSYTVGNVASSIYLCFRLRFFQFIKLRKYKKNEISSTSKKLLKYGVPLVPNSLAWWVTQLSDRYMVTYWYGNAANGIYSVAYKIPSILNMIVNMFMQAWQLSAIREYGDEDSKRYYNAIYRAYSVVCYFAGVFLISATHLISKILFSSDFYQAWQYVPILLIASVINSQESYWGSFYLADNRTTKYFVSSVIGAGLNVALNLLLIPSYGAFGASVATVVSYFVVYIQRAYDIKKRMDLQVMIGKNLIAIILLSVQSIIYIRFEEIIMVYGCCGIVFIGLVLLFHKEIKTTIELFRERIVKR